MLDHKNLKKGDSRWESYYSRVLDKNLVQYDFRDWDGELFSTVAPSLEEAERRRDKWLEKKRAKNEKDNRLE